MAQKSDTEREKKKKGGGGRGGGGERWALEYGLREREREGGGGGVSDLGKGRRLPVPNILRDEWENWSTQRKKTLVRYREKPCWY